MEYIVSARKYRPMSFDSVVGQSALTTTLKNAVKSNKLAHAYLFCGPRGVGKTTCARIFARAINCMNPTESGEACGECESCRSFDEQRSYNIFELDAASNNSVEDIKTLMEQTRIPPQVGRYKVFIIDEVHMLSTAAFNAFLKTLEEPPSHVVFILATTEKHKLLPTIISRCQIYDFERMSVQNIIDQLKMVADKEGYTYEDEGLAIIAEKADGGMRDALSIFDQVASYCQGNITYDQVIEDLNILDSENYFQIVDLALQNKVSDIMTLLDKIINRGFDGGHLCQGLASHIRNVMMARDPQTMQLLEASAAQKARYAEQAKKCPNIFLYNSLKLLNQCDINYRQSSNKRLLVELTLIQVAQITQPEDETPGAGRSPKRLKSLFKQIVRKAQSTQAAQQVAATVKTTNSNVVVETTSSTRVPQKTSIHTGVPSGTGAKKINIGTLGVTFSGLKKSDEITEPTELTDEPTTGSKLSFSQDDLAVAWLSMCNRMMQHTELKGLAARMKNISPVITEFPTIEAIIDNKMLMDQVVEMKRRILVTLKQSLGNDDITLQIRQAEPKEIVRRLSRGEILEELKKNNPAVEKLFNVFKLELS